MKASLSESKTWYLSHLKGLNTYFLSYHHEQIGIFQQISTLPKHKYKKIPHTSKTSDSSILPAIHSKLVRKQDKEKFQKNIAKKRVVSFKINAQKTNHAYPDTISPRVRTNRITNWQSFAREKGHASLKTLYIVLTGHNTVTYGIIPIVWR